MTPGADFPPQSTRMLVLARLPPGAITASYEGPKLGEITSLLPTINMNTWANQTHRIPSR